MKKIADSVTLLTCKLFDFNGNVVPSSPFPSYSFPYGTYTYPSPYPMQILPPAPSVTEKNIPEHTAPKDPTTAQPITVPKQTASQPEKTAREIGLTQETATQQLNSVAENIRKDTPTMTPETATEKSHSMEDETSSSVVI